VIVKPSLRGRPQHVVNGHGDPSAREGHDENPNLSVEQRLDRLPQRSNDAGGVNNVGGDDHVEQLAVATSLEEPNRRLASPKQLVAGEGPTRTTVTGWLLLLLTVIRIAIIIIIGCRSSDGPFVLPFTIAVRILPKVDEGIGIAVRHVDGTIRGHQVRQDAAESQSCTQLHMSPSKKNKGHTTACDEMMFHVVMFDDWIGKWMHTDWRSDELYLKDSFVFEHFGRFRHVVALMMMMPICWSDDPKVRTKATPLCYLSAAQKKPNVP
jgi:hypothetical protein